MTEPEVDIVDLLNAQAGKIEWNELARHFARGLVVVVGQEQDLLTVAKCLVRDQADEINTMLEGGGLHRANDEDAVRWQSGNTQFWAVVVAPWVLVQEI